MAFSYYAIIIFIMAYFFCSISSATIISRLMGLPDPRNQGSKNPGATNVLRLGGKKVAAAVLLIDVLKGTLPVLVGCFFLLNNNELSAIGIAAVVGHIYPVYYRFQGGKGVATALGVFYGLNVFLGLFCTVVWLIILKLFRFSSLSSLVMVTVAPFAAIIILNSIFAAIPLLLISILVTMQHNENISRLINKTEPYTSLFKS